MFILKKVIISFMLLIASFTFQTVSFANQNLDCSVLEKVFRTKVVSKHDSCKVELVRKDIDLTYSGHKISPETMHAVFHFTFEKVNGETAVIGEMALLEKEVTPVLDVLRRGKIEVGALHNHMLHEKPKIMFVHFQGIGDMMQQAAAIKKAIDTIEQQ